MAGFFWNVRGFNKLLKHSVVKEWIRGSDMLFGCVLETRVKEGRAGKIISSVFSDWSVMANYEYSQGGRIWLLWRDSVRMTPVYKSDQFITCSVSLQNEDDFFCTFIYASNAVEERKVLWEDLHDHHSSPMFRGKEWMLMGDFNDILEGEESSGFSNLGRRPSGMRDFQRMVLRCDLSDMGYQGPLYTWCNKREEGVICKKLDRVLMNGAALNRFQNGFATFEPGGCSDHLRCKIQLKPPVEKIKKPFKYVNAIGSLSGFLPMVQEYWESTEVLFHSTSAMFRFSKKLKNLKPLIRTLGREKLGNLTKRAQETYEVLCEKQKNTLVLATDVSVQEEAEAYEKWMFVAGLEEDHLKQKAKLHWLEVGDLNNKTFHNSIRARRAQNAMREIRCPDGRRVVTHEEIKGEAERHFSEFLNQCPEDYKGVSVDELKELLQYRCSEEDGRYLDAEVTGEEIRKVLFSMPSHKSPGPDGFPSEFFRTAWPVVGHDFIVAVQSVFKFSFLPKGVNSTILALVPKKEDSLEMKDFRPISCCNVLYKVVSKILANRLKRILPKIISENQSAFIEGRLLMENVLLASELVKDYHKGSGSPRGVMKIDISKAFDSVQWDFVLKSLEALGIPEKFIGLIKLCISTASFSVQVNGDLAGYFQSSRGLRQGCSLSPYLFVLCMNVLSKKIDSAAAVRAFKYHPRCKSLALTHLCFADDLMIFVEGSKESVQGALSVFDQFSEWSGLKISIEKSTLYLSGVSEGEESRILSNFPFAKGELPVRYLGLPLTTKAMRQQDYFPLVEKIRCRISTWTSRFLSYAGRLQLIKAVIMSLVNFWASVYLLPSKCIRDIERICGAFLWSGPELKSTGAKVAWSTVCWEKEEGGLGIRDLKVVNRVNVLKIIWRLLTGSSLWGKWIRSNLLKQKNFWEIKEDTQMGSWMWRKMIKMRGVARRFHKKDLGNGRNTSFWFDHWSEKGVLITLLGERGIVDMGIKREATVAEAIMRDKRRRSYRSLALREIEAEMETVRRKLRVENEDVNMWRDGSGYRKKFSTHATWMLLRSQKERCSWARSIWFSKATPKYAFVSWLAARNRLSTMDRIVQWDPGADTTCVLCKRDLESRNHLFFECSFSNQLWEQLTKGILAGDYTNVWSRIFETISDEGMERKLLCFANCCAYFVEGEE